MTVPLPKVTIRTPGSSRVSTTKPGTSRVCNAPTSRSAAQTASTLALVEISFRIEATFVSPPKRLLAADKRRLTQIRQDVLNPRSSAANEFPAHLGVRGGWNDADQPRI